MRNLEHGERWDLRLILDRLKDAKFKSQAVDISMTAIELKTLKAVLTELLNEKRFVYIDGIKVDLP